MAMIEAELALLEMEVEGLFVNTAKLCETHLCETPEVLNAVDMRIPTCKLIVAVGDPIVLAVPQINESVIPTPSIRMDRASGTYFRLDNPC